MSTKLRLVTQIALIGSALGCGSGGGGGVTGAAGTSGAAGTPAQGQAGTSGAQGQAGTSGAGQAGTSGVAGAGSAGAAGSGTMSGAAGTTGAAGTSGTTGSAGATGAAGSTGAAGTTGTAGTGGGGIGMDIPPWRALDITVAPGQHTHNTPAGQSAGMDNRSAKMAGKLVVDMGVGAGGYQAYLGKRGFHVVGISDVNACSGVDDWTLGNDYDTNCRLNTLDGMPHGNQNTVTPAQSIMTQVFNALTTFEKSFPGEGWGYFLTQDLKGVRWSDVAFTGFSHGAQSAACFASVLRVYRAVSQSGPRDNTCGLGPAKGPYNVALPPFDPNCPVAHIATWIDSKTLATPIDRFYGFVGGMDGQFGDIMFTMQRMSFVGDYVNLDDPTAVMPYGGSHRFYKLSVGHGGFPTGFNIDAINVAFGVLPENANPTF